MRMSTSRLNLIAIPNSGWIGIDNRRSNHDPRCISAIAMSPITIAPAVPVAPIAPMAITAMIAPSVMDPAVVTRTIVAMIR
jgi:hypothetical protein